MAELCVSRIEVRSRHRFTSNLRFAQVRPALFCVISVDAVVAYKSKDDGMTELQDVAALPPARRKPLHSPSVFVRSL